MGQDQSEIQEVSEQGIALPTPIPPDVVTLDEFQKALPKGVRGLTLTQTMIDKVNKLTCDPEFREYYRDNIIGYAHVLKDGLFTVEQYFEATKYVSFKVMGNTNVDSYRKTFPDRMQSLLDRNKTDKEISSYVAAYNKNKLVNLILEQTLIPSHVLNADIYQKAINRQAYLMINANSEKVQQDAANSLLTHLKPPETKKIELDIAIKQDSAIDELRKHTLELAAQQQQMIQAGVATAKETAESQIIDVVAQTV